MRHSNVVFSTGALLLLVAAVLLLNACTTYRQPGWPVECCGHPQVRLRGTALESTPAERYLVGTLVGAPVQRGVNSRPVFVKLITTEGDMPWQEANVRRSSNRPREAKFRVPLPVSSNNELVRAVVSYGVPEDASETSSLEQDRRAILQMAGTFNVTFNFFETVALQPDYALADPKTSTGQEVVLVIEDRGDVIRLQHILQVGADHAVAVKHWRQDWVYEPEWIHEYAGHNTWQRRDLSAAERAGQWAQIVYQVDDSPRYAAVARWRHGAAGSFWTGQDTWRPPPRRDATTRDDYHAIIGNNRHQLTPDGWVHEQDNTKMVLDNTGQALSAVVREVGINRYERVQAAATTAEAYWAATGPFWTVVREEWAIKERQHAVLQLTCEGEAEEMYMPMLRHAAAYGAGAVSLDAAVREARTVLATFVAAGTDEVVGGPHDARTAL